MAYDTDDELLDALGGLEPAPKTGGRTAREERIVAGFEDVQRFVQTRGRDPRHGEGRDIFERLYAVRLERLRALPEARALLATMDHQGLLDKPLKEGEGFQALSDEELLAELGGGAASEDIGTLRYVRSSDERRAAEEIANRTRCEDFETFEPLFAQIESDLASGLREARSFKTEGVFNVGDAFVLGGQTVLVAEKGTETTAANGQIDARLRVIYSNGTESNLLMRSLQRGLEKDDAGRWIVDASVPNLFSGEWNEDDVSSGTIYVLRSLSANPYVAEHRELIHKIGVTGGSVEARVAGAARDATYLLADVEVVATYRLAAINRRKLEALFHRIFAPAQLDLTLQDRFGHAVRPKEWFLMPLHVIDEAVRLVTDGSITSVVYDPASARLIER